MRIDRPWYLAAQPVRGFEEPEGNNPEGTGNEENNGKPEDNGQQPKPDDTAGLKSALEKERADRKAAQKELAAFQKAKKAEEDAEKSEIERLTSQDQTNTAKLQKLADSFRSSKVESAVVAAAKKAGFLDPTDALRRDVLSAIGVEQDEDDPTQVEVDQSTVDEAITKLAKAKPHWLAEGEDPEKKEEKKTPKSPSGSKFGGGSGSGNKQTAEQKLLAQYPALARRAQG